MATSKPRPMVRSAAGWTARRVASGVRYEHSSGRVRLIDYGRSGPGRYTVLVRPSRRSRDWSEVGARSSWRTALLLANRTAADCPTRAKPKACTGKVKVRGYERACPARRSKPAKKAAKPKTRAQPKKATTTKKPPRSKRPGRRRSSRQGSLSLRG